MQAKNMQIKYVINLTKVKQNNVYIVDNNNMPQ